jgi:hypothetical protein
MSMAPERLKNPDRHKTRSGVLGRPEPALRQKAVEVLEARDWTMNEFIVAALEVLTRNPDAMLDRLGRFKPPRRTGRPRKD